MLRDDPRDMASLVGIDSHASRYGECDCTRFVSPDGCRNDEKDNIPWFNARINVISELSQTFLGGGTETCDQCKHGFYTGLEQANRLSNVTAETFEPEMVIIYIRVLMSLYAIASGYKDAKKPFERPLKTIATKAEPFVFDYLKMDKSTMFMQPQKAATRKRTSSAALSSSSSSRKSGRLLEPKEKAYLACQTRIWAGPGLTTLLPQVVAILNQYDCFIATYCWLTNDQVLVAMRGKALYLRLEDNTDNKKELYNDIMVSEMETFELGEYEHDVRLDRVKPSTLSLSHSHSKMLVAGNMRSNVFCPMVGLVGSYNPTNTSSMDSMVEMYPADHVAHAIMHDTFIDPAQ